MAQSSNIARRRLYLASRNRGKLAELQAMLDASGAPFDAHLATDLAPDVDWDETGSTFAANARIKADAVRAHLTTPACILADDSGLAVDGLNGAPGVRSARYAGPEADDATNVAKLLAAMADMPDAARRAKFVCALCFLDESGRAQMFVGECHGTIASSPRGNGGFGYDPVFVVDGSRETLAEWSQDAKNAVSHRRRAFDAWLAALT